MKQILFTPEMLNITAIKKTFGSEFKGAIDGEITAEFIRCKRDALNEIAREMHADQSQLLDPAFLSDEQLRHVSAEVGLRPRVVATLLTVYGSVSGFGDEGWLPIKFDEEDFSNRLRRKSGEAALIEAKRDFPEVFVPNDEMGFHQNERQSVAMCIDHDLALICVKAGMFMNPFSQFSVLGYAEVSEMHMSHCRAEENQLRDYLKLLLRNEDAKASLLSLDWTRFCQVTKTKVSVPART
jgi:N-acetylmuramidase